MITRLGFGIAVVSIAPQVFASTYIVDDTPGSGVDFNDIPPAIAATLPGDILLVAPGSYSGFTLDRGLVIIGYAGADCVGPIEVRSLPGGQRAAVVGLTTSSVVVDACLGPVVLQSLGTLATLRISSSVDVRLLGTDVTSTVSDHAEGIVVTGSRIELVQCHVDGHRGTPSTGPGIDGVDGGAGIVLASPSRLNAARAVVRGGAGTLENAPGIYAGSGGPALRMQGPTDAIFEGPGSSLVGGWAGGNWYYSECSYDGASSSAVVGVGSGAFLYESGTTLVTYVCYVAFHCIPYTPPPTSGVTHMAIVPDDPVLDVSGSPTIGSTLTFTIHGEPGASATLVLGRGFVVQPTPGVLLEQLVQRGRIFPLGVLPASGSATRTFALPATLPHGFVFGAQAEVTGSIGLRRTNSLPIVVR